MEADDAEELLSRCKEGGCVQTTLMKAAATGDLDLLVRSLESTAANIDALDAHGRTALMLAARQGHTLAVRALLDAGADTEPADCDELDALAAAQSLGHVVTVQVIESERAKREALRHMVLSASAPRGAGDAAGAGAARNGSGMPGREALLEAMMRGAAAGSSTGGSRESPF